VWQGYYLRMQYPGWRWIKPILVVALVLVAHVRLMVLGGVLLGLVKLWIH
jgi:hypothetical protein